MQHFAQNTGKAIKLAQRVDDITYTCTGSELVALLLEEKEIKRLQPEVNRALRKKLFPFALYYFPDNEGYLHIRAEKIRKQTPLGYSIIKEYPKLAYAKGHLEGLIDEFDLCQNKSGEQTGSGACFNHRIGKCSGACLQLEDIESYNERVLQAVSYLQRIVHDSFYLIDQGREPGEKSVVMVEDGQFRGFGYMQDGVVIQHQEDLEDIIDEMPASRDAQRIIYWYVREKKMEQIIHFD
jgi:DNA polymerase-3 subunit epsilon